MKKLIIYGATSQIALEFINLNIHKLDKISVFVRDKKKFYLLFEKYCKKVLDQKNKIIIFEEDIIDLKKNLSIIETFNNYEFDGLLFLVGHTGNPEKEFKNSEACIENYNINLIHPVNIINALTDKLKDNSFICVFSSVAGIRGRSLRLFYCSAKAGLISYLSGLRQKLNKRNILVQNFIAGYMSTEKFVYKAPKFLISTPEKISRKILSSILKKQTNVYSSNLWFLISLIIKFIPEFIFKKLKF